MQLQETLPKRPVNATAGAGLALMLMLMLMLGGCSTAGYYWQSVNGHMDLLGRARPVSDVLGDAQTPAALKTRLELSQRLRSFAVQELKLPDNPSYRRYADLRRPSVVWNVVAAPEFSLALKTWCFALVGCVSYRGYFDEQQARAEADALGKQGLEVSVYGVPAYSTLGKLNWLGAFGGDPLLSTFITYPEGELARIIFHELAHQVVYAADDTMFNESFATAVERLGGQRWLTTNASQAARDEYAVMDQRRQQFKALALTTRRDLAEVYALNSPAGQDKRAQADTKSIAMMRFKNGYEELKKNWALTAQNTSATASGYDAWVARANNASFGAQAAYDELVPGFEALFEASGKDWRRFYDAVRALAQLPKEQRHEALKTKP